MPRKPSPLRTLLTYWPLVLGFVALLGAGVRVVDAIRDHARDDRDRDERLDVLERIACSEHALYCSTIYYTGAK